MTSILEQSERTVNMIDLTKYLYEKETITGDEFMEILSRPVPQISEQEA